MAILVTGGAGYIGSHTCIALLEAGYDIVVVDNFSNSRIDAMTRVTEITGRAFPVYDLDLSNPVAVARLFLTNTFEAVIHFAGWKSVSESVANPLNYYSNNLTVTLVLLEAMKKAGVTNLVFSSTAAVYGMQDTMPLREETPLAPISPYGRTKMIIEMFLSDVVAAEPEWSVAMLRYFNPVGAHASGLIGEDPHGVPNNLVPYISQVAVGNLRSLTVHGGDYPTPDGTCIRDYIHVLDLASGHLKALDYVTASRGIRAFNLGTGVGASVLEVIAAYEEASGIRIPWHMGPRRAGDTAVSYADVTRSKEELGWHASYNLVDMCRDAWRWQSQYPNGYQTDRVLPTALM
ncbi:UDP-glucose 4-epimerase GalE [Alicyclobacillus curvatus]|jgi:UDP-glucose 4-epimerase|nr:UDP-glucose 4-epimerase GalE [Alicyclobacillus curvatus]